MTIVTGNGRITSTPKVSLVQRANKKLETHRGEVSPVTGRETTSWFQNTNFTAPFCTDCVKPYAGILTRVIFLQFLHYLQIVMLNSAKFGQLIENAVLIRRSRDRFQSWTPPSTFLLFAQFYTFSSKLPLDFQHNW